MPMPTQHKLMWYVLLALRTLGGTATNSEVEAEIVSILGLSPEQAAQAHRRSRITELGYRCAWARTYLRKMGAISPVSKAVWRLTTVGASLNESAARIKR